jgi:hypothetical protein
LWLRKAKDASRVDGHPAGVGQRRMLIRLLGGTVGVASAALVYIAVTSLWRSDEMARTLAMMAQSTGDPFDANDWLWRWRVLSGLLLIVGAVGAVAGTGMVKRRRWALLLWCSLLTVLLFGQVLTLMAGYATYAFEQTGWGEIAVTATVAFASWIAAWTTRAPPGR